MKNGPHFDPGHWPRAIVSRSAGDETHLAMGDGVSLHRICLRSVPVGDPLAALIPCDALLAVTSHMVARRLVYPRLSIGQGASWKSSPERRRTQRLIREAEALAAGGYRALLAGRAGRQK